MADLMKLHDGERELRAVGSDTGLLRVIVEMAEGMAEANRKKMPKRRKQYLTT